MRNDELWLKPHSASGVIAKTRKNRSNSVEEPIVRPLTACMPDSKENESEERISYEEEFR
jgi:hypothetical protein